MSWGTSIGGSEIALALQWLFLVYFIALYSGCLLLNLLTVRSLRRHQEARTLDILPRTVSRLEPPVTVIVPTFNDQRNIIAAVHSLLQFDSAEYEVIVVNDGSSDATLDMLKRAFGLALFPESYSKRLQTSKIHGIYRSISYPKLRLIDKAGEGKADALNAGINLARYPLFCAVDADSVLQRDGLRRAGQPFQEEPTTIAACSAIRIGNESSINEGLASRAGFPRKTIGQIQVVEHMRAFLFGPIGWSSLNAVMLNSEAFCVFRKESVVAARGFRPGTAMPEMELVLRLHRLSRLARTPYQIAFVPDPICWKEAPETISALKTQRTRWQRGLSEALTMNLRLLFHARGGTPGWLAFPYIALFGWFGPLFEVLAYLLVTIALVLGLISLKAFAALIVVAISFGLLSSVSALLLEELSFQTYERPGEIVQLLIAAILENMGYRQLLAWWRLRALAQRLFGAGRP